MGERLAILRRSLARHLGSAALHVEPFRDGVDAFIDLVIRPGQPDAVVKSAKFERLLTAYDGLVDFAEVARKEVTVARLLAQHGVPAPAMLAWHRRDDATEDVTWILSEYVAHDATRDLPPHAQRQLGTIARAIHGIQPSGADRSCLAAGAPWDDWIVERIVSRVTAARRYLSLPDTRAFIDPLRRLIAGRSVFATSLLHLDLRAPNVAVVDDRIVAVFDYGNAIVGDPYFELARVMNSGGLSPEFLSGYGVPSLSADEPLLRAYGLDLAALLVVVTREEFEDESLHAEMAAETTRTTEWLAGL